MEPPHHDPPARVEKYRTSEGKEFVITRRPRRGRKYQEPQLTGDKLSCPYCSQEHDVISYLVTKGRKGQKKVRTWICPKVGKLPLNQGRQWDEYVESIVVRHGSEADSSVHHEAQTSGGVSPPAAPPPPTKEMPREMPKRIHGDSEHPDYPSSQELEPKAEVRPSSQTTRPLAEFPISVLLRPTRPCKVRCAYANAVKRYFSESAPSLDRTAERCISSIKATRRRRGRGS